MYVPAQPALPAVGWEGVSITSPAVRQQLLRAELLAGTTTRLGARLAVRSRTLDVLQGHVVSVAGALDVRRSLTGLAGRMVSLQALRGNGWRTLAVARTGPRGSFRLRFSPQRIGSERVRVRFAGDASALGTRRELGRLNVYRSVQAESSKASASYYGPGGALACGGSLTGSTVGVASLTLPCGTAVDVCSQTCARVHVIDRGPYVAGRRFDLTIATARMIGFPLAAGVAEIGWHPA
jgi:hypothetical protein